MKKDVNLVWVLFAVVSISLLIVSLMGCVDATSRLFFDDPNGEIVINSNNLITFTLIPTLFSLIVFYSGNKVLSIIGSILLFIQAIIVSFADNVFDFIDDIFTNIGMTSRNYSFNSVGIIAVVLCWILFLISLIFVCQHLTASNINTTAHPKNTKTLSVVLTIVFIIASSPLIINYMAMLLCILLGVVVGENLTDMSLLLSVVLITTMFTVFIVTIIFSIKKANKSNSKKYLWILVVAILLIVFIQIIFRHQFMNIWNDMFKPIVYSDGPAIPIN